MHDVGQQGAEGDDQPGPVSSAMPAIWWVKVRQRSGARCRARAPRRRRASAPSTHRSSARRCGGVAVHQVDLRPRRLEVVVLLEVDAGDPAPRPTARSGGGRRASRRRRRRSSRRARRSSSAAECRRRLQTMLHRSRRYRPSDPHAADRRVRSAHDPHFARRGRRRARRRTGWTAKPQGLCQGEVCVPAPGSIRDDGALDVEVVAQRLRMPLVHDEERPLGAGSSGRWDRAGVGGRGRPRADGPRRQPIPAVFTPRPQGAARGLGELVRLP